MGGDGSHAVEAQRGGGGGGQEGQGEGVSVALQEVQLGLPDWQQAGETRSKTDFYGTEVKYGCMSQCM